MDVLQHCTPKYCTVDLTRVLLVGTLVSVRLYCSIVQNILIVVVTAALSPQTSTLYSHSTLQHLTVNVLGVPAVPQHGNGRL